MGALQDFLFGEPGNFKTPAELARQLADLYDGSYKTPKSTEALLSQILRNQKPLPERLVTDIAKLLDSRFFGDIKAPMDFLEIANRHNETVREIRKNQFTEDNGRHSLWRSAFSRKFPIHHFFLNESGFARNYGLLYPILHAQGAALELIDPKHPDFMPLFEDDQVGGGLLWREPKETFSFSYIVPTKSVGISIWSALFRYACSLSATPSDTKQVDPDGTYSFNRELTRKVASHFAASKLLDCIKIMIPDEPWDALCGTSVCAFSVKEDTKLRAFILADGKESSMSATEAGSWKRLVLGTRPQWLKQCIRLKWESVSDIVVDERTCEP